MPRTYYYQSQNPPNFYTGQLDPDFQPINLGLDPYDPHGRAPELGPAPDPHPALPAGYTGTSMPQYMHDAVYRLLHSADINAQKTYEPYMGQRFAPQTTTERGAKTSMQGAINAPVQQGAYDRAMEAAQEVMGQSAMGEEAQGLLGIAAINPSRKYGQYMNPYQEKVLDVLERRANKNLTENILPSIRSNFISQGAYNSGKRNEMEARAARDMQESLMNQQAGVLSQGYEKALGQVNIDQQKALQAANLLSNTSQSDLWRQGTTAKDVMNLASQAQRDKLMQLDVLSQMGAQERALEQQKNDFAFEQHLAAHEFPFQQQARLNEAVRGLPATGQYTRQTTYTPQSAPVTSPYSAMGNALGAFGAAQASRQSARGGHFAQGGPVTAEPMQQNPSPERERMLGVAGDFVSGKHDLNPGMMMLAHMYGNMGKHHTPGNMWASMNKSIQPGVEAFEKSHQRNSDNQLQAANLFRLIDHSRSEERKHQDALSQKKDELALDKAYKMGLLDLNRGKAHAGQEVKSNIKEVNGKLYNIGIDPTTGRHQATLVEGVEPPSEINMSKLNAVDKKALMDAQAFLGSSSSFGQTLDELEVEAAKLNTGPTISTMLPNKDDSFLTAAGKGISRSLGATPGDLSDVGKFENLTNDLVLKGGNQLKGSTVPLGKLRMMEKTKPELSKTREANLASIKHYKDDLERGKEASQYIIDKVMSGVPSPKAIAAFERYWDDKQASVRKNAPFNKTPDDYLNGNARDESKSAMIREGSAKEAIKMVAPDGRIGMIPSQNVEAAMRSGFTRG
jgi:hypothetical protein